MKKSVFGMVRAGLLGGAALVALSGAAMAADLGGSYKDGPIEAAAPDHTITVNGGLTTDYVFRGISQSDEGPAAFVGADLTYKMFYVGVWASSVDDVTSDGGVEIDFYTGIKKSWNGVDLDVGVLYYAYPNNNNNTADLDYIEIKGALGTKIWRDISVTGTVYYSPDNFLETGEVWTFEGKASAPLPVWGLTLSGTLGTVIGNDDEFEMANGFDQYTYWNVGLSKTFREHFTVDVRYWGTDIDTGRSTDALADDRIVGTVSFNY